MKRIKSFGRGFYGWIRITDANWVARIVPIAIIVLILFVVAIWLTLPTAKLIGTPALQADDFEALLDEAQSKNIAHFELWYKTNIVIQCTLILTALLAAVFASLTTKDNAEHVKKWSVLLTAGTAALASVQSTFHIRENIETFIRATVDLNQLEADYLADRASFMNESKEAEKPDIRKQLLDLQRKYTFRYDAILRERMHAWANVGQPLRASDTARPQPNSTTPLSRSGAGPTADGAR